MANGSNALNTLLLNLPIPPPHCQCVFDTHAHLPRYLANYYIYTAGPVRPPNKIKPSFSCCCCSLYPTPLWVVVVLSIQYMILLTDFIAVLFVIVNAVLPRFRFCSLFSSGWVKVVLIVSFILCCALCRQCLLPSSSASLWMGEGGTRSVPLSFSASLHLCLYILTHQIYPSNIVCIFIVIMAKQNETLSLTLSQSAPVKI